MGVLGHLNEFRRCLTRISLSVLVGFLCAYPFATQLFVLLMKPMNDAMNVVASNKVVLTPEFFAALKDTLVSAMADKGPEFAEQTTYFVTALQLALEKVVVNQGQFIYTYPPEAFFAEVKVAVVAGIFLVSPYVFFQIWRFVAPGLYSHERRWVWPIAMISALFFVTGSSFGYFVVFPVGFEFFAQFTSDSISFMPKLSEYLSFALKLLIAFGVAFELPVFIFFLARLGIVTGRGLMKKSKYFILIAFIVGAVLTPPDPVSQALMAGPLILLYAIGVVIAFLFGKRKPKPAVEEPEEESPPAK
ncbi:MAG: twin-arginine translocase subunit TatC [Proteobacteria bacterium]|nr:twin-arginine translocase subunit TatC [Pseudomonadota bacterium]